MEAYKKYSTKEMLQIWSRENRHQLWRIVWTELARAQSTTLVPEADVKKIIHARDEIDLDKSDDLEDATGHEIVAELGLFKRQANTQKIHIGATSSDIAETATMMMAITSLRHIKNVIEEVEDLLHHGDGLFPGEGRSHFVPGQPILVQHRVTGWRNSLQKSRYAITNLLDKPVANGFRGPMGNGFSYVQKYMEAGFTEIQAREYWRVMNADACAMLGLWVDERPNYTQAGDRRWVMEAVNEISLLSVALSKMMIDLRLMNGLEEIEIKRDDRYVGSSSMTHKNNPIEAERITGICRIIRSNINAYVETMANQWLERSLDDSSVSRWALPSIFSLMHYCLVITRDDVANNYMLVNAGVRDDLYDRVGLDPLDAHSLLLKL